MQNVSRRERTIADDDMEMSGSRTVPADIQTTWRALNDPEVLKACIAGCESVERVSDNEYRVTMTARVGPVSARFTGRILMAGVGGQYSLQAAHSLLRVTMGNAQGRQMRQHLHLLPPQCLPAPDRPLFIGIARQILTAVARQSIE